MATPVGHSLFGLLMATHWAHAKSRKEVLSWFALGVLSGNAADFDFAPGLLVGDINRYHQGFSHSFLSTIFFSLLCVMVAWVLNKRYHTRIKLGAVAWVSGLAYLSHLILDLLTHDGREPVGIPLLWPFLDTHWSLGSLLTGVRHGVPGDSFAVFMKEFFSLYNVLSVGREILLAVPFFIAAAIYIWYRKRSKNHSSQESSQEIS